MTLDSLDNPLTEGLRLQPRPAPCAVVIFGASGDLARRKLMPGLFNLARQGLLPQCFRVIGTSRSDLADEQFRDSMRTGLAEFASVGPSERELLESFLEELTYVRAEADDAASFRRLDSHLQGLDNSSGTSGNRLFYLAVPPSGYGPITEALGEAGLNRSTGWTRLIVEKPFGRDLESMLALNRKVLEVFEEDQVYRIDHYLGKETVQNIMVLRFANGIFEPFWNQQYVDHVQITAAESIGIGSRGAYYDQSGAVRDMIQNHLLQVLSLIAMEPPVSLESNAIRDEKTKLVRSIRPITHEEVATVARSGQYGPGAIAGEPVAGDREEAHIDTASNTPTYAALRLLVDNWRWAGVPFYLRTGKRLPRKVTEVAIQFKRAPHLLFRQDAGILTDPNVLIVRIQPDEGITLRFKAKIPGQAIRLRNVSMDFDYGSSFGRPSPPAYERLLLDALMGDATLFARGDMVETSWRLVMPLLEVWEESSGAHFPNYEAGSWGPEEANSWIARDQHRWRRP